MVQAVARPSGGDGSIAGSDLSRQAGLDDMGKSPTTGSGDASGSVVSACSMTAAAAWLPTIPTPAISAIATSVSTAAATTDAAATAEEHRVMAGLVVPAIPRLTRIGI